jgi:hypothetical protein
MKHDTDVPTYELTHPGAKFLTAHLSKKWRRAILPAKEKGRDIA